MENNNFNYQYKNVVQLDENASSRKFIANVFMWMFVALGVSAFVAYLFATNQQYTNLLLDPVTGGRTGLGTIVMFAPIVFVIAMSFGINKFSAPVLTLLFLLFAVLMGAGLSFVLMVYTQSSVVGVFITASAVFGIMAVAGYTTNQDLTKFGSLMIMGLMGMVIASLVNMFIQSPGMNKALSYIGVAVFVGLTAYDVQKLKRIGAGLEYGMADAKKMAIMGALTLYLDFINLFLSLLRIFGGRRGD
ncbi:Bax inhibitor-1/YccA family protein [Mucilaginibacter terrae]|uniref:FtsH-binding integral membrane protein n=1 Tax=Mucilaginibacter terrae TaxID=1955052 RepID=A0ABU3GWJ7_9SPHI|nr:Bax inhibitor-1/YccA family protein [Mucilaginibacter terrae]MDT3404139.1 FtsH-binding integral membrane protein [Mucilaginibacter terrae]